MCVAMLEPDFFSHYDQLAKFAESLSGVANQLATATNSLQQAQSQLAQQQAALAHNVKETKINVDRIKCVSSHWFYGNTALQPQLWLRGGTKGKISRAEAKLAKFEEERPGLEAGIAQLQSVTLPPLQSEVNRLQALSNDKAGADNERAAMRERAVKSNPSPRLQYLNSTAEEWKVMLAFEQTNSSILKEVGKLCHQAHDKYNRALQDLQQANNANQAAIREHRREQREEGQDAQLAAQREAMDQQRRDRMMEQAARDADQAAGILTNAFAMVPAAVRQRYPAQCAQIGHVQVPLLSQTDFGNKMMEFFGGGAELFAEFNSGNKIRRNIAIVNQCKSVAHSQEQTVRALEAQLLRDADEARRQLQLTTQHLEAEKDQIMAALRNAMMHSGAFSQAAPAVPMAMMPAPPNMAMAAAYSPQMAAPPMATAEVYTPQMAALPIATAAAYTPQMAALPMATAEVYTPQMAAPPMAMAGVYPPMVMPAPQVAATMPVLPMGQAPIGAPQVQQDMAMQQDVAIMGQMMGQMATMQIGPMAQMSAMVQPQMVQQAMEQGQTAAMLPPQMAALPVATAEAYPPKEMPAPP